VNIPHWEVIAEHKFLFRLLESTQRKIKKKEKMVFMVMVL
jgi:hypothetical protein